MATPSKFRVIKRIIPMAWVLQYDCQGMLQPVPTEFLPVYIVQVNGTLWWHDVKVFNNIRDAAEFRNQMNEYHHGELRLHNWN